MLFEPVLRQEELRSGLRNCEYAVRGPISIKGFQLQKQLSEGQPLPFKEVNFCNIGNPQQLGQPPITFNRQVLACMVDKSLLDMGVYPKSVIERAKSYYANLKSIGVYTETQGLPFVRKKVAKFFQDRDRGATSNPDNIYLGNGASELIRLVLDIIINVETAGVMIPIPQYPLYSADIVKHGGQQIPYYLSEANDW